MQLSVEGLNVHYEEERVQWVAMDHASGKHNRVSVPNRYGDCYFVSRVDVFA